MNDDIIRMAKEAGFVIRDDEVMESDGYCIQTESVARFAALVAAAEREACARIAERSPEKHWCVATIRARSKA